MFLEQFIKYLTFEKRYSQHTVIAYKNDLIQFQQHLTFLETEIQLANHQNIRSWIIDLMDNGLDAKSINRKISTLRSFYKFLQKEKVITDNPVQKVLAPKTAKKLPVFITDDKLTTLLDSNAFNNDFESLRDKLVLELLFGTGIRLSELLNLKTNNVYLIEKTLKVLGKRNKERIIPIHFTLINLLRHYIVEKNNQDHSNNLEVLIVTNTGAKGYPKLIYRIVQKYLSLICTQEK